MTKKLLILLLLAAPLFAWGQSNTWEKPEEEETDEQVDQAKPNPDAKYLRGAVTEKDGRIVFQTTIECPGKSRQQAYAVVRKYVQKMLREKNQVASTIITEDSIEGKVAARFDEWLVFKSNAIILDRTQLLYVLEAECRDGQVGLSISRISYIYGERKDVQRYKAEEWISDRAAVNKKNTRLLPLSAKFRRKTIDRKNFLFNKFTTLLQ